jgi:hypothetical protein
MASRFSIAGFVATSVLPAAGAVFTSLDEGVAHLEHIGFEEVVQRGATAVQYRDANPRST